MVEGRHPLRAADPLTPMKVTLDLKRLVDEGKLTRDEADWLATLSAPATSAVAFNLLIGFGLVAVSASLLALVPDPRTGVALGVLLLLAGLFIYTVGSRWELVGHICVILGAIGIAGGVVILAEGSSLSFLAVAAGFAAIGVFARSNLLVAGAVLAAASALGERTDGFGPSMFFGFDEPAMAIVVFGAVALLAYGIAGRLAADFGALALTAARTAWFVVNVAFWFGSVGGDEVGLLDVTLTQWPFVYAWAIGLILFGAWGAWRNRLWAVNAAAVAGAIHLVTQWFLWFGANPLTILAAGVATLVLAVLLWNFNRRLWGGRKVLSGAARA